MEEERVMSEQKDLFLAGCKLVFNYSLTLDLISRGLYVCKAKVPHVTNR